MTIALAEDMARSTTDLRDYGKLLFLRNFSSNISPDFKNEDFKERENFCMLSPVLYLIASFINTVLE